MRSRIVLWDENTPTEEKRSRLMKLQRWLCRWDEGACCDTVDIWAGDLFNTEGIEAEWVCMIDTLRMAYPETINLHTDLPEDRTWLKKFLNNVKRKVTIFTPSPVDPNELGENVQTCEPITSGWEHDWHFVNGNPIEFKEEWFEVLDKHTGTVLARGPIKAKKTDNPYHKDLLFVSSDQKWFFNTKSENFSVKQIKSGVKNEVSFESMKDDYEWSYWRNWGEIVPDIYREFGIDELDPEVVNLVTELNKWPGIETIGSCSGHDKAPLWVQFNATNCRTLNIILNVIRSPGVFPEMVDKFHLPICTEYGNTLQYYGGSSKTENVFKGDALYLVLMTKAIGKDAYNAAETLAKLLSTLRSGSA